MEKIKTDVNAVAMRRTLDSSGWVEIAKVLETWVDDLKEKLVEGGELTDQYRGAIMALRNIIHFEDYIIDDDAVVKNSPQLADDPENDLESDYDETRY